MKAHELAKALEGHEGGADVCDELGRPVVGAYQSEAGYVALTFGADPPPDDREPAP